MQEKTKIETYLGFCIRAGKAVFGVDRMETLKRADLLVIDSSLADGSAGKVKRLAEKLKCPLVVFEGVTLGEVLHRPACKAMAITQKNLAEAILAEVKSNTDFKLIDKSSEGII